MNERASRGRLPVLPLGDKPTRMPTAALKLASARDPIASGFAYLQSIQRPDGSWKGDYDGPLFLLPGYIFAHAFCGRALSEEDRRAFISTLTRAQNQDGSFGIHLDGPASLFGTVLNYVALRFLGVAADDPNATRARAFIRAEGGASFAAPWAKFWLSVMNLYSWEGVHPVAPELWLLPKALPTHPSRFWCHARAVYLPVSYLFAKRIQMQDTPLHQELRQELYPEGYDSIDFVAARERCAARDRYASPSKALLAMNKMLGMAENAIPAALRERACASVLDHIRYEEEVTHFIDIGPVSKAFIAIVTHVAWPQSAHAKRSFDTMHEYIFDCARGRTMLGYYSTQSWDTMFTGLALAEAGADAWPEMARGIFRYLEHEQVRQDPPEREKYFRDKARGGWTFGCASQDWPVVDCTAFAMMATLALERNVGTRLLRDRYIDATDLLLFWQNADGGFGTYERARAGAWIEKLNPSEIFGDIMHDLSHVELSSSAIQALNVARGALPLGIWRRRKVERSIARAEKFIRGIQRLDGSWEGAWGICFTYGTMFGVWGLRDAGALPTDPAITSAVRFLLSIQMPDGGWGEDADSCRQRRYVAHLQGGQIAMTAWSLLALLRCEPTTEVTTAIARGVRFLIERQQADGDWPVQGMTGVFNRTCMLNYRFYRNHFPLWALAMARKQNYL